MLACAFFLSCNNAEDNTTMSSKTEVPTKPSNLLDGLVGTWQIEEGKNFERWTRAENGFHVVVFSVPGTDTTWREDGNIFQENGKWIFENKVN